MINFNRIQDQLFVGTCPKSEVDVQRLKQAGISAVVNLQSDRDFVERNVNWPLLENLYYQYDIAAYRAPMIDFDEANIEANLVNVTGTLASAMDAGHRVYLHCTAGMERSPTTAVAWMAWFGGMSLDQAMDTMIEARPSNPYKDILRRLTLAREAS